MKESRTLGDALVEIVQILAEAVFGFLAVIVALLCNPVGLFALVVILSMFHGCFNK